MKYDMDERILARNQREIKELKEEIACLEVLVEQARKQSREILGRDAEDEVHTGAKGQARV